MVFACHREDISKAFVAVTLERLIKTTLPEELINDIKHKIRQPLKLVINETPIALRQSFHPYIYDRINDVNQTLCRNPANERFKYFAPKVPRSGSSIVDVSTCTYCQPFAVNKDQLSSFFINDLFFCDQVVFNETEFEYVGTSIYVQAINKVFHDMDYQVVFRDSRTFVHVCGDKASYVPLENLGKRVKMSVRYGVLILLMIVF